MEKDPKWVKLRDELKSHLVVIAELFTQRPKISIIIRFPEHSDDSVYMSNDDPTRVIMAIRKIQKDATIDIPD